MDRRLFINKSGSFLVLGGLSLMGFSGELPDPEKKYKVIAQRCNGCGHCYRACRDKAITEEKGKATIDAAKCKGCGDCTRFCHHMAIVVEDKKE